VQRLEAHAHLEFSAVVAGGPRLTQIIVGHDASAAGDTSTTKIVGAARPRAVLNHVRAVPPAAAPTMVARAHTTPSTEHREHTVTTARHEVRVPEVARMVPKAPTMTTEGADIVGTPRQFVQPPARRAAAAQPLAPTPGDLATITNRVLTEIDRRLIANHERRGRG
jgi:hypothetical protein